MGKFEELREAMEAGKTRALDYRDACHDFAAGYVNRFREHIECPGNRLVLSAIDDDSHSHLPLASVMSLEEDGFLHFHLGLVLVEGDELVPPYLALFPIGVMRKNGRFLLKLGGPEGELFEFDVQESPDYTAECEWLFDTMMAYYGDRLDQFLSDHTPTVGRIGF